MKLFGLLQDDTPQQLDEHLGNLDAVDKELATTLVRRARSPGATIGRGFKRSEYKTRPGVPAGKAEEWKDGVDRTTNTVYSKIGRGSAVDPAKLKFDAAAAEFSHDDVGALIYMLDGKQVFIITLQDAISTGARKPGYKESLAFAWRGTSEFFRSFKSDAPFFPGTKKTFMSEFVRITKSGPKAGTLQEVKKVEELLRLFAQHQWAMANPAAKVMAKDDKFPELDLLIIKFDKEREQKHADRVEARKDMVPVPKTLGIARSITHTSVLISSHNAYIQKLVGQLKYKANALRNKRAAGFDNTADMLEHVIREGYVKKLNFMGKTYNLTDSRISLDDLMKRERGTGDTYVEYKCETALSYGDPKIKAANDEYEELVKQVSSQHDQELPSWVKDEDEADDEKRAESRYKLAWAKEKVKGQATDIFLKHGAWPSKMTIRLVLEGGRITPFKIDMNFSMWG
jgi:hypothetical protein